MRQQKCKSNLLYYYYELTRKLRQQQKTRLKQDFDFILFLCLRF